MSFGSHEEARKFDPDHLYLEELERRRELGRITQQSAEVIYDLQEQQALYRYVMARREKAKDALSELVDIDPRDAAGIAALQVRVHEFVDATKWIHGVLNDGRNAEQFIQEEYDDAATHDA